MQGLLPRLADGELDLAVVNEHPLLPETASTAPGRAYLFDDAFQVVLPRRHRLARSGAGLDLPDLAGEAWVGGRVGSAWFRIVRHACRTAGSDPRVALSSDDYRAVQAFVAAGLGVAVIPGLAVARAARRAPDDSFQPPAVRTMITILETITRRLRTPAA